MRYSSVPKLPQPTVYHILALLSLSRSQTVTHHIQSTVREPSASSELSSPESNSSSQMSTEQSESPPPTPSHFIFDQEAFARGPQKISPGYGGFPPGGNDFSKIKIPPPGGITPVATVVGACCSRCNRLRQTKESASRAHQLSDFVRQTLVDSTFCSSVRHQKTDLRTSSTMDLSNQPQDKLLKTQIPALPNRLRRALPPMTFDASLAAEIRNPRRWIGYHR